MNRVYGLGLLSGVGLGLVTASGLMLGLSASGFQWDTLTGIGAWLGLFTAGFGLMLALAPWVFPEPVEQAASAQPATPIPAQPQYDRVFNSARGSGVERRYKPATPNEGEWINAAADFLLWARQVGSLAGPAHVGVSVQNPNDWQLIIAPLVDFGGVAPTQKGVVTRYAADYDATRLYNAVLAGWVQFPDTHPPKITPYSAQRMTVDVAEPSIG